jgi:type I restriction enzyme, S subunit
MSWTRVPLRNIGRWYGGGTPSKSNASFWTDGTIPWLSPKDMGLEVLRATQDRVTPSAVNGSAAKLVPAGAVAIVTRSGILERTVPVTLVPFETTLNQDMKAVVPKAGVDARWVAWGLRAFERDLLRATRKAGTTVASIEMPRLYAFELPVPTFRDQQRILAVLEDHLSRLDAAVASIHTALRRADQLVVSSLAKQVAIGRERGYLSTVGEQAEIIQYGSGARCGAQESGADVPVLRMGNVKNGALVWESLKYLPAQHADFPKLLLKQGDLLFNRTNSAEHVGKSAVFESDRVASFASYLIRVRFGPRIIPEWASMVINSPMGRQFVASVVSQQVGQANVNGTKLKSFPLPVPPLDEQRRRVADHSEVLDSVGRLRQTARSVADHAQVLRRSLLMAAFSGGLGSSASEIDRLEEASV